MPPTRPPSPPGTNQVPDPVAAAAFVASVDSFVVGPYLTGVVMGAADPAQVGPTSSAGASTSSTPNEASGRTPLPEPKVTQPSRNRDRCLLLLPPGATAPAPLLSSLRRRDIEIIQTQDAYAAAAKLCVLNREALAADRLGSPVRSGGIVLIVCDGQGVPLSATCAQMLQRYAPRVACWRYNSGAPTDERPALAPINAADLASWSVQQPALPPKSTLPSPFVLGRPIDQDPAATPGAGPTIDSSRSNKRSGPGFLRASQGTAAEKSSEGGERPGSYLRLTALQEEQVKRVAVPGPKTSENREIAPPSGSKMPPDLRSMPLLSEELAMLLMEFPEAALPNAAPHSARTGVPSGVAGAVQSEDPESGEQGR